MEVDQQSIMKGYRDYIYRRNAVIGIDPGICNTGYAVLQEDEVTQTETIHLFKTLREYKKMSIEDRYGIIKKWADRVIYDSIVRKTDKEYIVIEGQMKKDLIAITYFLYGYFKASMCFEDVLIVHPTKVKKKFKIGTGNYKNNKDMAVLYTGIKDHNQADAVLLAKYLEVV